MKKHYAVPHPAELLETEAGRATRISDWLATHLAVVFGVTWTVWLFFLVPLVAYFLPSHVQSEIFFFSSGWIQLFALPLLAYVSSKIQKSSDAQSDAMYQALTHVATEMDLIVAKLEIPPVPKVESEQEAE